MEDLMTSINKSGYSELQTNPSYYPGLPYSKFDGKYIVTLLNRTFGKQDSYSEEQFAYILDFLYPVNYALKHNRIGSNPMTVAVPIKDLAMNLSKNRPYQIQILNDTYPNIVVKKSRQIGCTMLGTIKTLLWCDRFSKYGTSAGYFFPTYKQLNSFVKSRFNEVLKDAYFKSIMGNNDSIEMKQIRNTYMHFRTSSIASAAEGLDLSYAAIDEYERCPAQSESSIMNSLKGSDMQYLLRFSTPSAPDVGTDRLYNLGDQWNYMFPCNKCGYYNDINFKDYEPNKSPESNGNVQLVNPDGVDTIARVASPGTYRYVCAKCGAPLPRTKGIWVCKYPSRTINENGIRSYNLSQLSASWITCDMLKTSEMQARSKQDFYNYDLGDPYLDRSLAITPEDIYSHTTRYKPAVDRENYSLIVAGIDWGQTQHTIVILGMRENGTVEVINNFQVKTVGATDTQNMGTDISTIERKLDPYSPDMIVCDIGDSGQYINILMNHFGRQRVYGCQNNSSPTTGLATASGNMIAPKWNDNDHIIKVDKLLEVKRHISLIKSGKINFYKKRTPDLEILVRHWQNVIIKKVETPSGMERTIVTRKGSSNQLGDHSSSAEIIGYIGLEHLRDASYGSSAFDYTFLNNKEEPTDINKKINDNSLFE